MEPSNQSTAVNHRLSRRNLLVWSAAGISATAAGLLTSRAVLNDTAHHSRVLFHDSFAGHSLDFKHWNPYICDNQSKGWPWFNEPRIEAGSSAMTGKNGLSAEYDLPSAVTVDGGLT